MSPILRTLRAMSEAELIALVDTSPRHVLETLHAIAGIDDDCHCGESVCDHAPRAWREWYLPMAVQARLLLRLWPREYGERPFDPEPAFVFLPEQKAAIMARRHKAGLALFRPGDLAAMDLAEGLARPVERLRNGSPVAGVIGTEAEIRSTAA